MAGIIGIVAFAWVLTQWGEKLASLTDKPYNYLKFICLKCWSFWLGWLVTFNWTLSGLFNLELWTTAGICGLIGYALGEILLRIEQGKW